MPDKQQTPVGTTDIGTIRAGGHDLEYRAIAAERSGPTLVFLHQGMGSIGLWRQFPELLCSQTGLGGIVYSRVGHGESARLTAPLSSRFMHDEALIVLPDVMRALGIDRPILVGHSDGGSIALIYAGAGIGPVAGLLLEAPHVFVEPITNASIRRMYDSYYRGDLKPRLARHHRHVDDLFRHWIEIWMSPAFREWNIEDSVARVDSPTLVIQGTEDEYGTEAQVKAIEQRIAGPCETIMLTGVGHSLHAERPDDIARLMTDFIKRSIASQESSQ